MELMVVILQDVLVALGKNLSFFIVLYIYLAHALFSFLPPPPQKKNNNNNCMNIFYWVIVSVLKAV
jgi:hypothetical protein